jgi:hypothetical protein
MLVAEKSKRPTGNPVGLLLFELIAAFERQAKW